MNDLGLYISAFATIVASCTFLLAVCQRRASRELTITKQTEAARALAATTASAYGAFLVDSNVLLAAMQDLNPSSVIASPERWIDLKDTGFVTLEKPDFAASEMSEMTLRAVIPNLNALRSQRFSSVPRRVPAVA